MKRFNVETFTKNDLNNLICFLKENHDLKYKEFHSRLLPGVPKETIVGIRLPFLRKLGKQISKGDYSGFLKVTDNSNNYYETNMLKGLVTAEIKTSSFNEFTNLVDNFINYIDNWAVCDSVCNSLKEINKYKEDYFNYITKYLNSNNPWHIRAAYIIMLSFYLEDEYIDEVIKRVDSINHEFYYVQMAQAWLVATAYAKFPDKTHSYLKNSNLNDSTYNKAIQKARESRRVDKDTKDILNRMKR